MSKMKQIEAAAKELVHFMKNAGFRKLVDSAQDGGKTWVKYSALRGAIDLITEDWKPHEVYDDQLQFFQEVVGNIDRITVILNTRQSEEDEREAAAIEIERIHREILDYGRLNWYDAVVTLQVRLINVEAGTGGEDAAEAVKAALVEEVEKVIGGYDIVNGDAEGAAGTHEWIKAECEVVPSP